MPTSIKLLFLMAFLVIWVMPTQAQTSTEANWVVNSLADDPRGCPETCTLRSAVNSAAPGEVIGFSSDLSGEITLVQPLQIDKGITIAGPSPDRITIRMDKAIKDFMMVIAADDVTISGVALRDSFGISVQGNNTKLSNLVLSGHQSSAISAGSVSLQIENSLFENNSAEYGAALSIGGETVILNSTFRQNSALYFGGAISGGGSIYIENSDFENNSSGKEGGAIFSGGGLEIQSSRFTGNRVLGKDDLGWGIQPYGGTGGAIQQGGVGLEGWLIIRDSVFTSNSTRPESPDNDRNDEGGAIAVFGEEFEITGTSFVGNTSKYGGALHLNAATALLGNVTFADNSAEAGGALYYTNSSLTLLHSTLSRNQADSGGGVFIADGTPIIGSSLISGNSAAEGTDVYGVVESYGYNLIGKSDGSSGWFASDLRDIDPVMGELDDYGNGLPTIPLLEGSPAIDAAGSECPELDQRGTARQGACDIGAFEFSGQATAAPAPATPTPALAAAPPAGTSGKILFASNRDENWEIYVMEADGSNQRNLTNNAASDEGFAWSPDGSQIAFGSNRDGNWEIYVMAADGGNQRRLTNNATDDSGPLWSPDGSQIAFISGDYPAYDIYVMNVDGSNLSNLTNGTIADLYPLVVWSPDGSQIGFVSHFDIYVMNADGSNVRQLTNTGGNASDPTWSPDGSLIAYTANDIYVMNADGSDVRDLTRTNYDMSNPAWSPDSSQLSFTLHGDDSWEIYVVNADGSNLRNLSNMAGDDRVSAWSPDGSQIAFRNDLSTDNGSNNEVYVVNADGSNLRNLTNNPASDVDPAWQPFGGSNQPVAVAAEVNLDEALQRASAGVTSNAQWKDWYPQGVVQEFEGIPFVLVPAGCFMMGNDNSRRDNPPLPTPAHQQCFDEPFWISQTEVTQGEFSRLGGVKYYGDETKGDNLPIYYISWLEARDFAQQNGFRLPTEREWEYAARGPDGLAFPWGNEFVPDNVVFRDNSTGVADVGSHPGGASWVGALDMSGNVDEWVSSSPSVYPYVATDGREEVIPEDVTNYRGLRGGSWLWGTAVADYADYLRADTRGFGGGADYFGERGMRLARSLTAETGVVAAPVEAGTPDVFATQVAGTVAAMQPQAANPTGTPTPDIIATAVAATLGAMQQPTATPTLIPTDTPTPDIIATYVEATLNALQVGSTPVAAVPLASQESIPFASAENPNQLNPVWIWLGDDSDKNTYEIVGGALTIHAGLGTGGAGVCVTTTTSPEFKVLVKETGKMTDGQTIFLLVSEEGNSDVLFNVARLHLDGQHAVGTYAQLQGGQIIDYQLAEAPEAALESLYLQSEWQGSTLTFSYGVDSQSMQLARESLTAQLPSRVAICLWATASYQDALDVTFEDFRLIGGTPDTSNEGN